MQSDQRIDNLLRQVSIDEELHAMLIPRLRPKKNEEDIWDWSNSL